MAVGLALAVRGDRRGVRGRFPSPFLFRALHAAGPLQPSLRRLEGTAETEISVYTQPRRPSARRRATGRPQRRPLTALAEGGVGDHETKGHRGARRGDGARRI